MQSGNAPTKKHRVLIEYCDVCGFLQRYEALKDAIQRADPSIDVDGLPGRHGAFEVYVDRKWLVHSRLKSRSFPQTDDLIKQLVDFYAENKIGSTWEEDEW